MITINSVPVAPMPQQAPLVRAQPVTGVKSEPSSAPQVASTAVAGAVVVAAGDALKAQMVYTPPSLPPVSGKSEVQLVNAQKNAQAPERSAALNPVAVAASVAVGGRAVASDLAADETNDDPATGALDAAAAAPNGRAVAAVQNEPDARAQQAEQARQQADAQRADQQRAQINAERQRAQRERPPQQQDAAAQAMEKQINELLPNMWKASRAAVDVLIGEDAMAARAARADVIAPQPDLPNERVATEATENYSQIGSGSASGDKTGTSVNQRA